MSEPYIHSRSSMSHFSIACEEVKTAVNKLAEGIADLAKRVANFAASCFQDIREYCFPNRHPANGSQGSEFENANPPPPRQNMDSVLLEQKIDAILTSLKAIGIQIYQPKPKMVKPPIVTVPTEAKDRTPELTSERIKTLKEYDRRPYKDDRETSSKLNKELAICYQRGKQETDKPEWKSCEPRNNCVLDGIRENVGFTENLSETSASTPSGYSYSVLGAQGKRSSMEDAHLADSQVINLDGEDKTVSYFGVFDGHGGSGCSEFVAKELGSTLTANLENYWNKDEYLTGITNALKMTCVDLNDTYNESNPRYDGTTAVIAVVIDDYLWIANVGDSRALLVLPEETVQLSDDAKPLVGNGRFDQSIKRRAGKIFGERVGHPSLNPSFFNVAVGRDIGFGFYEGCLTARPKVLCVKLSSLPPGTKLGLVCDGITDVASTNQIGASIRAGATAASLVQSAFDSDSSDNLSAMVIALN